MSATSIFVSYSHEDNRWFAEDSLIPWLARSLKKDGVELWWDHDGLSGGDPWRLKIEQEIDRAQIALLLVSQGFLNSDFIEKVELPRIRARAERNELVVIPILTEPCEWEEQEFIASRQMVPGKATPLINYLGPGREADWAQARFEILSTIKKRLRNVSVAHPPAPAGDELPPVPAPTGDAGPAGRQRQLALFVGVPLVLVALVAGVVLSSRPAETPGGTPGPTAPATALAAATATRVPAVTSPAAVAATALAVPPPSPSATPLPAAPITVANAAGLSLRTTLRGHNGEVTGLSFSPLDGTLASSAKDGTVRLWDVERGLQLRSLSIQPGETRGLAFSPDGKTIAVITGDEAVRLLDPTSGKELSVISGFKWMLWAIAFSPDGKLLAGADGDGVKFVDLKSGEGKPTPRLGLAAQKFPPAISVAFSPDGKTLAAGTVSDMLNLWDAGTGQWLRTLRGHSDWVGGVVFSPDGKTLISASRDDTLRRWDQQNGDQSSLFAACGKEADDQMGAPISIVYSPDGKLLASACKEKTVKVWEAATGKLLATLAGHEQDVYMVAFSPDGRFLVSGGLDATVRVWAVAAPAAQATSTSH